MYVCDDRDHVRELKDIPQCNPGAPLPVVVAAEHRLDLLYLIEVPDPHWDGSYVKVLDSSTDTEPVACVRFKHPYAHFFGPPNDEAFSGHPLAARGLKPYAAWEVRDSSWIRALERMNSVHPYHSPKQFEDLRHFIFAFHDSTFECIAERYEHQIVQGSIASVAADLSMRWK